MKITTSIGCGFVFGFVAAACGTTTRTLHANHCANQGGNDWCRDKYDDGSRPYCSRGTAECEAEMEMTSSHHDGCIAARPADDACYSPCGGRLSVAEDPGCLGEASSSSGNSSSGTTAESSGSESSGGSSTTGPMPCVGDEECTEPGAPFCGMTGECGPCEATADPDGACAGIDPLLPLCVGGACVACTPENPVVCDDQLLLCDGGTNACVPCTAHGQCGSGACELAAGTCFPAVTVVHVDGDGGQDFATVSAAVASIGAGLHGVIVVYERDGDVPYAEATIIDGGKAIALLAAPGEAPVLLGTGGNPGLTVEGAGTILYIEGLRVAGNTMGLGLQVNGAFAWVDRSRIVQNSGGGVLAENGAELTLRNCFVGGASADVDAIAIDGSVLDLSYTTVGGGSVIVAQTRALFCVNAATAEIRNSVLLSLDTMPEIVCPGVMLTNSASESDVGFNATWFNGYANGDFSLSATGATTFTDIAVWQAGDPPTDIDGDPRPTIDATPDYAGADVPQ